MSRKQDLEEYIEALNLNKHEIKLQLQEIDQDIKYRLELIDLYLKRNTLDQQARDIANERRLIVDNRIIEAKKEIRQIEETEN